MFSRNKNRLLNIIKNFSKQNILVIGDIILDKYSWCSVNRISPEVPAPVALISNDTYLLGGASNVANNLVSLGAKVDLLGSIGSDSNGEKILNILDGKRINHNGLLINNKVTTIKQRIMCDTYQLLRIDNEDISEISSKNETDVIKFINGNVQKYDAIILSDYSKGFISKKIAQSTIKIAKKHNIKVLVDPTPESFFKFKGAYLIKPNKEEAEKISGIKINKDYSNLLKVGKIIKNKFNSNSVITLGRDGLVIFNENKELRIQTSAKEVFDVSGAGDTVISVLALCLASGASLEDSAVIANYCAGLVVAKLGTSTCSAEELKKCLK